MVYLYNNFIHFLNGFTLKKRIVIIFATSTFFPLLFTVIFSYNTISSILTNKLEVSVKTNLRQVDLSLENVINNLNHVSQQLSSPGGIGSQLDTYLSDSNPYQRAKAYSDIKSELNVINFTNPSIGLTMFYLKNDDTFMLNNFGVQNSFSLSRLPLLANQYKIQNYGPHKSLQRYSNQYVLSALRKVNFPPRDDVFVYVESDFDLAKNVLQENQIAEKSKHLILDKTGKILYSEHQGDFPVNSRFQVESNKESGSIKEYYWFRKTTEKGWSIVILVPKKSYNQEKNQWVVKMIYLINLFLILSLLIAWVLWYMVYKPLNLFNYEINLLSNSNFHFNTLKTKVPEFDQLLDRFQVMKYQISSLFKEVEIKEKKRADLEVEKLIHQINPHFLMNTLDSVRWLATVNGQKDIEKLVLSLNKLLYYNLGKLGTISTIQEEIDSTRQYLNLQQVRYEFTYDMEIQVNEDVLQMPVPRFILQPLVENSLYHGLDEDGHITISIKQQGCLITILVQDNGKGISEEKIHQILNETQVKQQKNGMGIGMNYVKRMIDRFYDGNASLEIKSFPDKGTTIALNLPIVKEDYSSED